MVPLATERALRADLVEEVARMAAIVRVFKRTASDPRSEKLDPT